MTEQEALALVGQWSTNDLQLILEGRVPSGKYSSEWSRASPEKTAKLQQAAHFVLGIRDDLIATEEKVAVLFRDWTVRNLEQLILGQLTDYVFPERWSESEDERSRFVEAALIALDIQQGQHPSDKAPWTRRCLQARIRELRLEHHHQIEAQTIERQRYHQIEAQKVERWRQARKVELDRAMVLEMARIASTIKDRD